MTHDSPDTNAIRRTIGWIMRHAGAAIALALIVGALLLGYRIGRPATDAADATDVAATPAEPAVYTCSMHPSVRLPDADAKCPICFMDLIPAAGDPADNDAAGLTLSKEAAAASRIEATAVARFFPTAEVRLYGKVAYDETSVARITAYFAARIDRLFVNYVGVPVAPGDHIAKVYSPELLAAFEELRQAARLMESDDGASDLIRRSSNDTRAAAREKLRLYGLTPAQIEAAERATEHPDRLEIFSPIGGVVTHLAVREGDYVDEGSPIATVADLSRLWLDLEAYESQLPLLRWGQPVSFTVESHPGEVFEGRVSFIEPMVDVRTRTAAVRVAVDNADRRLKPGMFASAVVRPRLAAGGDVLGNDLAGRWVGPMHPTVVRDSPGSCDICGMDLVPAESLGVAVDADDAQPPLVIPRSAVLFTGTRSIVYVEAPDADAPTYRSREVMLGPRAGEFYLVRDGIAEGERVVVRGAFRIDSAMQIVANPSMMSERETETPGEPSAATLPDAFVGGLEPVYTAYLDVQAALADDDFATYERARGALDAAVSAVPEAGVVGEPLGVWRRAQAALRMGASPDIETARAQFEPASQSIINLLDRFGHAGEAPLYVAYCPMAFDFTGAAWLQQGGVIDNPYFGASMLLCGEIRRDIPGRGHVDVGAESSDD